LSRRSIIATQIDIGMFVEALADCSVFNSDEHESPF